MRIVSANVFCLNVRPSQAIAAVAAQKPDVAVLIELLQKPQELLTPARH